MLLPLVPRCCSGIFTLTTKITVCSPPFRSRDETCTGASESSGITRHSQSGPCRRFTPWAKHELAHEEYCCLRYCWQLRATMFHQWLHKIMPSTMPAAARLVHCPGLRGNQTMIPGITHDCAATMDHLFGCMLQATCLSLSSGRRNHGRACLRTSRSCLRTRPQTPDAL